jgi:GntR family transcriptional regulator
MLNTSSPIPLYYQLKARIEENIETGLWKPGDRVPSESEFERQFGISRTTVRQALGSLVNQGMLTRVRGKGTFVAQPRINQHLLWLTSFTQDMQARGKKPGARVLQIDVLLAPPQIAKPLLLSLSEKVIAIKRLRLADNLPMAVETSFLIYDLHKDLLDQDLAQNSLYGLLTKKLNCVPTRAHQEMEAIACPMPEAGLLGVRKGTPVLHIHRTTYDQVGKPFEQVESFYRGDRYVFQVELSNHMLQENA